MNQILPVTIADFGKDHWGLLAYVETRVVDHKGKLEVASMRCNPDRHPAQVGRRPVGYYWSVGHGTRLKGFFKEKGQPDLSRQLPQHDDFDCLVDLEENGLLVATGMFDAAVLTPLGRRVANDLREHKAAGKNYADFEVPTAVRK